MKRTIPGVPAPRRGRFQGSERDTQFPGGQRIPLGQFGAREDSAQRGRGALSCQVLPQPSCQPSPCRLSSPLLPSKTLSEALSTLDKASWLLPF